MVVCFSIGSKSKAVVNTLSSTADNVDFYIYDNVQDLIKEATLRHISFKRIVLSSSIIKNADKDLSELNNFIKEVSANTEVILIVGKDAVGSIDIIFNRLFNAPMYTPVIMPKANSKTLLELVLSDVGSLKAKYYELDNPKEGTFENSLNSSEIIVGQSDSNEVCEKSESLGSENSNPFSSGPASLVGKNGWSSLGNEDVEEEDSLENSRFQNNGLSSYGNRDLSEANSDDTGDDLSIGDFGSSHSDTGYLDEEDDEELQEYLENKNEEVMDVVEEDPQEEDVDVNENLSQRDAITPKNQVQEKGNNTKLNIDLVISTRGVRSTKAMVDEALDLYKKDKANILIIDLDYKENRMLSFLDTEDFYRKSNFEGISKLRIHSENNIDFCSNGYKTPINTVELRDLLLSKVVSKYELILIDCPVDCLNIIDDSLISMFNVLLYMGSERMDLIEMSLGLTNRDVVSLFVERYIMSNCDVEVVGNVTKLDLNFVRNNFLFANGSWLDKVV